MLSISDIKDRLDNADKADQWRWEAAEGIVAQLDGGMSMRDLSTQVDRSTALVGFYARVWRERETHGLTDFQEAYRWVQANPKNPRPAPAPEPEQPVERPTNVRPAPQPNEPTRPAPTQEEVREVRQNTEQFLQPIRNALNSMDRAMMFPCIVGTLGELTDSLRESLEGDAIVDQELLDEAYSLVGEVSQLLMQWELRLSAQDSLGN